MQLDFGWRSQNVSIFRDSAIVELDYHTPDNNGHSLDRGVGRPGRFVAHGAEEWLVSRKTMVQKDFAAAVVPGPNPPEMNREDLYPLYPQVWYNRIWNLSPEPLSYKGWVVLGMLQGKGGYGLLFPAMQTRWIKLMREHGGVERAVQGAHKAYIYVLPNGDSDAIVRRGREIVDSTLAPGGPVTATTSPGTQR